MFNIEYDASSLTNEVLLQRVPFSAESLNRLQFKNTFEFLKAKIIESTGNNPAVVNLPWQDIEMSFSTIERDESSMAAIEGPQTINVYYRYGPSKNFTGTYSHDRVRLTEEEYRAKGYGKNPIVITLYLYRNQSNYSVTNDKPLYYVLKDVPNISDLFTALNLDGYNYYHYNNYQSVLSSFQALVPHDSNLRVVEGEVADNNSRSFTVGLDDDLLSTGFVVNAESQSKALELVSHIGYGNKLTINTIRKVESTNVYVPDSGDINAANSNELYTVTNNGGGVTEAVNQVESARPSTHSSYSAYGVMEP